MAAPDLMSREPVCQALRQAGWRIDDSRADRIEASHGSRYAVAVFLEEGQPVAIEYGDGEQDLQHGEDWHEAPGILAPADVGRLFHEEKGEQ